MITAEAISASTTGTLKPTSMSGEKRLRRTNDETALRLFRWYIVIGPPDLFKLLRLLFCYALKHFELF
jgi:hypothetical protein